MKQPVVEEIKVSAPVVKYPAPRSLSDILGQGRALDVLQGAMRAGRVHHAWIFHGPRGVGKFTTALAFASALLDPTTAPDLSGRLAPDPESPVQRLLRGASHPDLHVITKELARLHEDRQVRERKLRTIPKEVIEQHLVAPATRSAAVSPGGLASKVFIVDEAELLDRSASHAPTQASILKTMEEPDGRTVIILVSESEDRLLPTIRSRCQRVWFAPLGESEMRRWLSAERAGLGVTDEAEPWLLEFAAGSPGEFIEAWRIGLHRWHEVITPLLHQLERGKPARELGVVLAKLVDEHAEQQVKDQPEMSKEAATRGAAALVFRLVAEHFRRSIRLTAATPGPRLPAAIDAVRQAEAYADSNVAPAFVMEWLSAELPAALGA